MPWESQTGHRRDSLSAEGSVGKQCSEIRDDTHQKWPRAGASLEPWERGLQEDMGVEERRLGVQTDPHLLIPALTCPQWPSLAHTCPPPPRLLSEALTCPYLCSLALIYPHLPIPVLTPPHLLSQAYTCPHLPSLTQTCPHWPSPALTCQYPSSLAFT